MWGDRTSGPRRAGRRAFRPSLEGGRLESRELLSGSRQRNVFFAPGNPNRVGVQVARAGRSINVTDVDGELYRINATNEATIRAVPTRDGRLDLIVNGSKFDTEVLVNRLPHPFQQGASHDFPAGAAGANGVLRVRNITVRTGAVQGILGFGTVDLSGAVTIRNPVNPDLTPTVDRLAFQAIRPGTRIDVAGTVNTIDVLTSANFDGPRDGIVTGADLNLFNVRNDLNLLNGAAVQVGRDLGAIAQAAKGTGDGGAGGSVQGSLSLSNGGRFVVLRRFATPLFIRGDYVVNGTTAVLGPLAINASQVAPAT